jgi:hypothetical protein
MLVKILKRDIEKIRTKSFGVVELAHGLKLRKAAQFHPFGNGVPVGKNMELDWGA